MDKDLNFLKTILKKVRKSQTVSCFIGHQKFP